MVTTNSQTSVRLRVSLAALLLGGAVGAIFAPAYQMASLIVACFGAFTAQASAYFASSRSMFGLVLALLALVAGAALMFFVARENPAPVVIACTKVVFICGSIGTAWGHIAGRLFVPG